MMSQSSLGASAKADRAAAADAVEPVVSSKASIPCAFTPGPWIVTGDLQDGYLRIRDAASEEVLATTDDGGHVDPQFAIDDDIIEANARLIAAAPELYEALETAARRFRDYEQIHRLKGTEEGYLKADKNADLAIYCEAALAKARGQ
jgi:hypothetical protein